MALALGANVGRRSHAKSSLSTCDGEVAAGTADEGASAAKLRRNSPPASDASIFFAQRRKGAKKVLARPVMRQSYFGDDAAVTVIRA